MENVYGNKIVFLPDSGTGSYNIDIILEGFTYKGQKVQRFISKTVLVDKDISLKSSKNAEIPYTIIISILIIFISVTVLITLFQLSKLIKSIIKE